MDLQSIETGRVHRKSDQNRRDGGWSEGCSGLIAGVFQCISLTTIYIQLNIQNMTNTFRKGLFYFPTSHLGCFLYLFVYFFVGFPSKIMKLMNVDSMYHDFLRQNKQISSVLASFRVIFQAKERSNDSVPTNSEWIVASFYGKNNLQKRREKTGDGWEDGR